MIKKYKPLLIILSLLPTIVYASNNDVLPLGVALIIEAFVSIHMALFVIYPISKMISNDVKKTFIMLFLIRVGILLFFDLFVSTGIAFLDFIAIFIGAFIVVPIMALITKKRPFINSHTLSVTKGSNNLVLKCANCKQDINVEDKFCPNCGMAISGNNIEVSESKSVVVKPDNFDPMFSLSENDLLETFLKKSMSKHKLNLKVGFLPKDINKRKIVLYMILSLLTFVLISLIFFHVGVIYYLIGLIILFIFYKKTSSYNFMNYLKREVKSRPGEEIDNIVLNVKNTVVKDSSKKYLIIGIISVFILSTIVYFKPHAIYEKNENGYTLRFYTAGLSNFTKVNINETHKGKNVTAIRGEVFKNMKFLKSIKLPDTITEIRGQVFLNNTALEEINIPNNLVYLGGSAFKNCKSLKEIKLPDSLEYIGGEAFKNAKSLEYINIPKNLKEIRGNTFENDSKLKEITIPDSVTRIGGHAFYGCRSLAKVELNESSNLKAIGSSAFRQCSSLYEITVPATTSINSRAFKESPTKVKRFGEIDYGSLINKNNYKYNSYEYLKVGEEVMISKYYKNSTMYLKEAKISLKNINVTENGNTFTLIYKDKNKTTEFKLDKTNSYKIVNDDFGAEISSKYILDNSTSISINTYFN